MTTEEIERRLAELETRIAFHEQSLLELSDALAASRDDEARTALLLHRALDELRQLRTTRSAGPVSVDPALEPPPPHGVDRCPVEGPRRSSAHHSGIADRTVRIHREFDHDFA